MKAIAFSDLHVHPYTQHNENGRRLKNCLRVLEVVEKAADAVGADCLLFCGDLVDQHKAVPNAALNGIFEHYSKSRYTTIAVSGNHDYGQKRTLDNDDGESVLKALSIAFPDKFKLIDNSRITVGDTVIHGVPYYEYAEHLYQRVGEAAQHIDEELFNLLLVHVTAEGYIDMNIPGTVNPKHDVFRLWDYVLSGDIHKKRLLADNFQMLGSPIHKVVSDAGDDKGIWYIETAPLKPISTKFKSLNPYFPTFKYVAPGAEVTDEEKAQHFIRETVEPLKEPELEDLNVEKFQANNKPAELVRSYYEHACDADEELLNVGLSFLPQ